MAHLSPIFSADRGSKHEQWNEKYEKPSSRSPVQETMTSAIPPPPPLIDGLLSKSTSNRSDQNNLALKSSSFNEKKCQVYVHHFNKMSSKTSNNYLENNWRSGSEIHQNLYKHEFSEFYNNKLISLKKQFDNLSIQAKKQQTNSPYRIQKGFYKRPTPEYNHLNRMPYVKSSLNSKIDKSSLFKPEHKAIIDKLEESYWAKWKPHKKSANKAVYPKTKGLYTENEKIKVHYQHSNKNGRKERGDSNSAIISPEKDEAPNDNLVYVANSEQNKIEQEKAEDAGHLEDTEEPVPDKQILENENEVVALVDSACIVTNESDLDCSFSALKHTDSFILTAKKQSQEKSRFQQPKCIKLFKNEDYTTTTQTNYIKGGTRGGTYPLKSCLKKEISQKSNHLGRPGSPVKAAANRRPGKANRFTK